MSEEISKQYEKGFVDLISIVEPLIDKFKVDKNSIDIQQLQLVTEYLITDRELDENHIDELEMELDKEKLNSLNLSEQLNKEKEKNIQDMIKDFECSNFIKNNYIHKNKIETLLQDVDNTKFINKHLKGMYLYDNLKCLLEE